MLDISVSIIPDAKFVVSKSLAEPPPYSNHSKFEPTVLQIKIVGTYWPITLSEPDNVVILPAPAPPSWWWRVTVPTPFAFMRYNKSPSA